MITARFGLKRSIHESASATLKWLGCGRIANASKIQTSRFPRRGQLSGGEVVDIGRIGGIADAIAQRGNVAVLHEMRKRSIGPPLPSMVRAFPASIECWSGSADSSLPGGDMKQ